MIHNREIYKETLNYIRAIERTEDKLLSVMSVEALHRLRTNTRRLSTALDIYKEVFALKKNSKFQESLLKTMKLTSKARDLDVFYRYLADLQKLKEWAVYSNELRSLRSAIRHFRLEEQYNILNSLAKKKRRDNLLKLKGNIQKLLEKEDRVVTKSFYKHVCKQIHKQIKAVLDRREVVYKPEDSEGLHKLRLKIKALRYSLEGLRTVDRKKQLYINHVLKLHRDLGDVHDFDVRIASLLRWSQKIEESDRKDKFLRKFNQTLERRRKRHYAQFLKDWEKSCSTNLWDQLQQHFAYESCI